MLDVVYDTFGNVNDAFGRVRHCVIEASHGQRSCNEIDVSLYRAVFAFDVESGRSNGAVRRQIHSDTLCGLTHILGPLMESCPKDESAGNMDVSSHCLVKFALALKFVGVDDGAAGYITDVVAVADDVVATCRGCSLPCRRSTNSSSVLPKSSVIESKVFFQGTLIMERMMT